jgi:hypothetical protein
LFSDYYCLAMRQPRVQQPAYHFKLIIADLEINIKNLLVSYSQCSKSLSKPELLIAVFAYSIVLAGS